MYKEYENCIIWNKVSNQDAITELLTTFDELLPRFKKAKEERQKNKAAKNLQIRAEDIYNSVMNAFDRRYIVAKKIPSLVKEGHLAVIVDSLKSMGNVAFDSKNIKAIEEGMINKIQSTIDLKIQPLFKSTLSMAGNKLSQEEIRGQSSDLLKLFINMLNLLPGRYIFVLSQGGAMERTKREKDHHETVVVEYEKNQQKHKRMAVVIRSKKDIGTISSSGDIFDIQQYYPFKRTFTQHSQYNRNQNRNRPIALQDCCHSDVWLGQVSQGDQQHPIQVLMFVLLLVANDRLKEILNLNKKMFIPLTQHKLRRWFDEQVGRVLFHLRQGEVYQALEAAKCGDVLNTSYSSNN